MTPDEYRAAPWPHRIYHISVMRPGGDSEHPRRFTKHRKAVDGYVCWLFASRKKDGGGWSLDHLPTGCILGTYDRLMDAKDAARALVEHTDGTEAWEFTDPDDRPPEVKDALVERGHVVRRVI